MTSATHEETLAADLEALAAELRVPLLSWTAALAEHAAYLPGAASIVVFGVPMLDGVVDTLLQGDPPFIRRWFAGAGWRDYLPLLRNPSYLLKQLVKSKTTFYNARYHFEEHLGALKAEIDRVGLRVGRLLEARGQRALPVDPCKRHYFPLRGFLCLKSAAAAAGLGQIGRHRQVIAPGLGTRVWLGGVLTTAPLPGRQVEPVAELCDDCDLCEGACPVVARRGGGFTFSTHECTACSRCLAVCPAGR